jgi:hypothetical protein
MDCKNKKNNLRTLHEPNPKIKENKQSTKNIKFLWNKNPKIFYELQIQINYESTTHANK